MFINYLKSVEFDSPINLGIARGILGVFAIWKLISYEWYAVQQWPKRIFSYHPNSFLVFDERVLHVLQIEALITVIFLLIFTIGYRTGVTGFTSAVLIAHLVGIHKIITNQGVTFLPVVYMLLLFALYRHEDYLSVDAFRQTKHKSLADLNEFLQTPLTKTYSHHALRWALVATALIYFFTGFGKVQNGLFDWATSENLGRTILATSNAHIGAISPTAKFMLNHPLILSLAAWGSVLLELGLLATVLAGVGLTWAILGLLGMHTMIALSMNIFFFDQYLLFALFLPWDRWHKRTTTDPLEAIYDEESHFCVRSLYFFKHLDTNGAIDFQPQSALSREVIKDSDIEFDDALYVVDHDKIYQGYHAYRRLFQQFQIFIVIAWLMKLRSFQYIGDRIYRNQE